MLRLTMRRVGRPGARTPRPRPRQWREIPADSLARQEAVSIRSTVISHLRRTPSSAPSTVSDLGRYRREVSRLRDEARSSIRRAHRGRDQCCPACGRGSSNRCDSSKTPDLSTGSPQESPLVLGLATMSSPRSVVSGKPQQLRSTMNRQDRHCHRHSIHQACDAIASGGPE